MGSTATYKCKCCGHPFIARTADRKRGWAKFCSKSCKAIRQTQRTGYNPNNYRGSGVDRETYLHYAREYGGMPQFDRRGNYVGFTGGGFDNAAHQNHGDPAEAAE
ncbi:MAG: hypothetical protein ACTHOP_22220 [Mesorhizobium sp.]